MLLSWQPPTSLETETRGAAPELQRFAWIKPKIICRSCINIIAQELGLVGAARPGLYDPDVIEWVARLAAGCCTLLKAADVPGPYVLVAHSFSGTIARVFAGEHPDEVKGIVFVDVLKPELRAQMTPEEWKIWKRVNARPAAALAAYPESGTAGFRSDPGPDGRRGTVKAHAGRRAHGQRQVRRSCPEAHPSR
jgi:pimeloyl-ACP methyl ester carboxylesterase